MNVQTEHLDNHTARVKVEIDLERLDKAKQKAARKVAKEVNIPGFRKGKVPYNVLIRYVGEASIIEEALEDLGQEVYREALESAQLDVYGPGAFDNFDLEGANPLFVFTVPLQPVVNLGTYRDVRVDFSVPAVEDKDVDAAMRNLQQEHALVETSERPAALGNRVTVDIHSHFIVEETDEAQDAESDVAEDDHDDAHDHQDADEHGHGTGETFVHQHDSALFLTEIPDDDPFLPGFSKALLGANVDDTVEFELTVPTDEADYGEDVGRRVHFSVTIKKIDSVTLPVLNDDFAARVSADETPEGDAPMTLLQLRLKMRENLEKAVRDNAQKAHAEQALSAVVEQADIRYPQDMIDDQIEDMIEQFDNDLRRQGMNLDYYMQVTGRSKDALAEELRDPAIRTVRRSLVLRSLVAVENITVSDADIQEELGTLASQLGAPVETIMELFGGGQLRDNIRNNLLQSRVMDRLSAIARGEAAELPAATPLAEAAPPDASAEEAVTEDLSTTASNPD